VAQHPFPGPEHDGDEPAPGVPARDWDADEDRYLDWLTAEIDAGRIEVPLEEPPPGVTVSLGEAGDADLDELARMAGALSGTGFSQDQAADAMPPGPVLGALATPLPALTNITVSAGTLLGWSDAPAEVAGFGLTGPGDARDLIAAASRHPRSRWCVTVLGSNGEAIAHGCASGRHPWTPVNPRDGTARAGPDDHQRAQLAGLLRQLGITLAPIAKGECDHRHREDRYRPSRKLGHLVRARTATCPAPGCNAQAIHNELDHTVP
jgi:hypothetical protein